jgi:hypothetical protein
MRYKDVAKRNLEQQHCQKYTTLLHFVISNRLLLVVDILKICEFKVTETTVF